MNVCKEDVIDAIGAVFALIALAILAYLFLWCTPVQFGAQNDLEPDVPVPASVSIGGGAE